MCAALLKDKAAEIIQSLQLGVACRAGAEKIAHGFRRCIEEHWMDEDFVFFNFDTDAKCFKCCLQTGGIG